MASMRDIKRRRSSIQSTQQITKAMKLVSTVKLQRARAGAERSKSYFTCMYDTMNSILARVGTVEHKYLKAGESGKKAVILITSNRGLAGGYNSNVSKLITKHETWNRDEVCVYAIGNKGKEILSRAGYEIKEELPEVIEQPAYADAMFLTERLLKAFEAGEISEIYLAYTAFKNTVSHIPTLIKLLPVEKSEQTTEQDEADKTGAEAPMNFEPEDEEALDLIIPKYVASLIYGGLV
ncbi:MAG: F0F1 ATP synthase subunit gamma, partial [Lachnospiraceae bacterium]|nr:F0F1 ATP synthase subunit gamma [Lachnospiraceae bacterium]